MCKLTMKNTDKIRYGYKVVAIDKKTGKHWSIAMGFCYDDHETIPKVVVQNEISGYFHSGILNSNDSCYEPNMIGRTAIFEYLSDADIQSKEIKRHFDPDCSDPKVQYYRIAIMSCHIEEDIMSGQYGELRVIAGRKLTFISEMTN